MARPNKTILKAQELAGEPLEGFVLGSRVHPLFAMFPTLVLLVTFAAGILIVQMLASILVIGSLFLTLGRSLAITRDELIVMQGRPPLFRPSRVVSRRERVPLQVEAKRLYWKIDLGDEVLWANKAFTDQVQMLTTTPLKGAKIPPGGPGSGAGPVVSEERRERQVVQGSKRITPKGSRNRKPRKYRR